MKNKLVRLLHWLDVDALLLGLFEKLAERMIKKFLAWVDGLQNSLIRAKRYRNEFLR